MNPTSTEAEEHNLIQEAEAPAPWEDPAKLEALGELDGDVEENIKLLVPVEKSWQPSDFLPDAAHETFIEEIEDFRERAAALPDDLLVTLVGDMVTEEALPSYQTSLNRPTPVADPTGDDPGPWAQWSRGWTAEENRHGDLLNRFLYLSGRVDMKAIEVTIHHLIRNGFNPGWDGDVYRAFVYTSFQERATRISHGNVATLARKAGHEGLARICRVIANDESRHEEAYKRLVGRLMQIDPVGAILSYDSMMRTNIVMPARLMDDGDEGDIFEKFSTVAQRIGVYTALDYAQIIEHLNERWKIDSLTGLSGEAAAAQDRLCRLPKRYARLAERFDQSKAMKQPLRFSWIHGRTV